MGARDFDAVAVGRRECAAWAAYYRHEWAAVLRSSVGMVRAGFEMPWPRTLLGAWWVLRANLAWAPVPDNDPEAAVRYMRRFYRLVVRDDTLSFDPDEAARREVEWWRLHRLNQRGEEGTAGSLDEDLVDALIQLYSYVYTTHPDVMTGAARHRVEAMALSDAWVAAGCRADDPTLAAERRALVASYSALRTAVGSEKTQIPDSG